MSKKNKKNPLEIVEKSANSVARKINSLTKNSDMLAYCHVIDGAMNIKLLKRAEEIVRNTLEKKDLTLVLLSYTERQVIAFFSETVSDDPWTDTDACTWGIDMYMLNDKTIEITKFAKNLVGCAFTVDMSVTTPFKYVDTVHNKVMELFKNLGYFKEDSDSDEENYATQFEW
jgi:hypothetical protein